MSRFSSRRHLLATAAVACGGFAVAALAPKQALAGACCQTSPGAAPAGVNVADASSQSHPHPAMAAHPAGACPICGMDLEKFAFSKVRLEYPGGKKLDYCSIHCAAIVMSLNHDGPPDSILAADLFSKELVDAETAAWTLGGKKPGVMTARAKWAFAKKAGADAFLAENGGEAATFDQVMQAAYADMYGDLQMIRKRRQEKKAKMAS